MQTAVAQSSVVTVPEDGSFLLLTRTLGMVRSCGVCTGRGDEGSFLLHGVTEEGSFQQEIKAGKVISRQAKVQVRHSPPPLFF